MDLWILFFVLKGNSIHQRFCAQHVWNYCHVKQTAVLKIYIYSYRSSKWRNVENNGKSI